MSTRSRSKFVSGAAILAVATVAGTLSFQHIFELSLSLHQGVLAARLMPIAIDGLIVVGSVVLLQSGSRLGWLGVGPGLALSVFANVESGLRFGTLSAVWAAIPSLSFFLATYIFERWLANQARKPEAVAVVPNNAPEAELTVALADVPGDPDAAVPLDVPVDLDVPVPARVPAPRAPRRTSGRKAAVPAKVFSADLEAGRTPAIREIKSRLHIGTDKARIIQAELAAMLERVPEAA